MAENPGIQSNQSLSILGGRKEFVNLFLSNSNSILKLQWSAKMGFIAGLWWGILNEVQGTKH
jgi:hypothetical protein